MSTKANQLADALQVIGSFGLNTRIVLHTNKQAFKAADEFVDSILTDKDTPENIKRSVMACFDGGFSADENFS